MDYATPVESCYSPEKCLNIGKTKFVLFEEDYEKISPYLFAFVWQTHHLCRTKTNKPYLNRMKM